MSVPLLVFFIDTYKDDIHNMKLLMLEYVIALQTKRDMPDVPFGTGTSHSNNQEGPKIVLETLCSGFSILPILLPFQTWNKHNWEQLFTTYMGWHYCKIKQIYAFQMFTYEIVANHCTYHIPTSNNEKLGSLTPSTSWQHSKSDNYGT